MSFGIIAERELSADSDMHILVGQEMLPMGQKAVKAGTSDLALRRVVVFDEERTAPLSC